MENGTVNLALVSMGTERGQNLHDNVCVDFCGDQPDSDDVTSAN